MILEIIKFIEQFTAIGFLCVGYYHTLEYVHDKWGTLGVNIMTISTVLVVIINHFLGV